MFRIEVEACPLSSLYPGKNEAEMVQFSALRDRDVFQRPTETLYRFFTVSLPKSIL
jgi:hypothetical protein